MIGNVLHFTQKLKIFKTFHELNYVRLCLYSYEYLLNIAGSQSVTFFVVTTKIDDRQNPETLEGTFRTFGSQMAHLSRRIIQSVWKHWIDRQSWPRAVIIQLSFDISLECSISS